MAASVPLRVALLGPAPRGARLRLVPPDAATAAPSVSVVVVNFCQWRNTAHLTRELQNSDAVRDGRAEVVIVDNHSPRSPLVKKLRRTPGVSLRRFGRNRGFARAVNEGCRLSRGEWFLLLNPDMSVPPGFLDQVLDYAAELAKESPNAGIVGFRLRHPDGSRQASCGPFPTLVNTLGGLLLPRKLRKCRHVSDRRQRVPWVTGCCLLIRRECLEEIGGFDEDFFLYYEDVDFCRRARRKGWSVWYDPRLEVAHHSPLHLRRVVPPLRLMTRHALLTYSRKHWAVWQTSLLSGVVWLEAWARERLAKRRGEDETSVQYGALRAMVTDLIHGREDEARKRLRHAARCLDTYAGQHDRAEAPDTGRAGGVSPLSLMTADDLDQKTQGAYAPRSPGMKLSVVIPSHRRDDLLTLCLDSVTRFAPTGSEILVVDDGSRDGIISRAAERFPNVRILSFPKPQGFCRAANAGILATSAPFVELLNDDTRVTEGWADHALRAFDDPAVGAVAPLLLSSAVPTCVDSAGDTYDRGGFARKRGHGHPVAPIHQEARDVFGACGAAAFYRRSALERTGLFPESFGAYFEDVDLSFRLHWAGYRVKYQPASRVWHVGSSSYGKKNRRLIERQSCNEERVFWRNLPGPLLRRSLPRHLAVLAGKALRRWQEGTFLPFLLGRLRVLGEAGEIVRHRRRLRGLNAAPCHGNWSLE